MSVGTTVTPGLLIVGDGCLAEGYGGVRAEGLGYRAHYDEGVIPVDGTYLPVVGKDMWLGGCEGTARRPGWRLGRLGSCPAPLAVKNLILKKGDRSPPMGGDRTPGSVWRASRAREFCSVERRIVHDGTCVVLLRSLWTGTGTIKIVQLKKGIRKSRGRLRNFLFILEEEQGVSKLFPALENIRGSLVWRRLADSLGWVRRGEALSGGRGYWGYAGKAVRVPFSLRTIRGEDIHPFRGDFLSDMEGWNNSFIKSIDRLGGAHLLKSNLGSCFFHLENPSIEQGNSLIS